MLVVLAVLVVAAAALTVGGLLAVNARLTKRLRLAEDQTGELEVGIETLRMQTRHHAQVQHEHKFLVRFLREFPHLTRDLSATVQPREIPKLILNVITRIFEPESAAVMLRRQAAESQPERRSQLVVAAASPAAKIAVGTEVPAHGGAIGLVMQGMSDMTRWEARSALAGAGPGEPAPSAVDFDLLAPMVFSQETLGVIGLSCPARPSDESRAALRLIAQAGAQAIHSAAAYAQMKTTADVDGLTGVYNKRHVTRMLSEAVLEAQERAAPLSVFLFDVDNFKVYNDVNGHVAGDQLLKELARLVRDNTRSGNVFGRFGGEEFLLVLPDTPLGPALVLAEKLRALIESHAFPNRERQPLGFVSVSGGVAEYPNDALDGTRLVGAADQALYVAKGHGRNRVLAAERRYLGEEPSRPDEGER